MSRDIVTEYHTIMLEVKEEAEFVLISVISLHVWDADHIALHCPV